MEHARRRRVNVVTARKLQAFWAKHPEAEGPLSAWLKIAQTATWKDPHAVRADFGSADFVGDNRVVFNIGGNKYRLVTRISYTFKQVLVKFVGTHAEYDRINVETVQDD